VGVTFWPRAKVCSRNVGSTTTTISVTTFNNYVKSLTTFFRLR
jgi:hypothetical protein